MTLKLNSCERFLFDFAECDYYRNIQSCKPRMKYKVSFFRWKSMNWNDNKFQISQGGGEGKSVFEPNDQALDGIRVISAFACRPFSRRQMKNKFQSTGEGTQQINTLGINWNFKKCNVTKHLQWRLNSLIVLNCMSSLDVFVFVFLVCFCFHDRPRNVKQTLSL